MFKNKCSLEKNLLLNCYEINKANDNKSECILFVNLLNECLNKEKEKEKEKKIKIIYII